MDDELEGIELRYLREKALKSMQVALCVDIKKHIYIYNGRYNFYIKILFYMYDVDISST